MKTLTGRLESLEGDFKAKGRFRLLFTLGERIAETVFYERSRALVTSSDLDVPTVLLTPEEDRTQTEQEFFIAATYLTMREDFRDAGEIRLDDPAVIAALDFYVAVGLLTQDRRDEILGTA